MDATEKASWDLAKNIGMETRRKSAQMVIDDICLLFYLLFINAPTTRISVRGTEAEFMNL
jgi:hypothetical protein